MRWQKVSIAGIGYVVPPRVVSSAAIEDRLAPVYERLGLVPGRLELMTGIKERRAWPEPTRPSAAAAEAAEKVLEASPIEREAIGCLIHASVCRDFLEPATANVVHDRIELGSKAQVFDLSNACLGVLNGMLLVADMIELGRIEAGLIVAGENGMPLLDSTIARLLADKDVTRKSIKDSFASLTIGSGAAAVLLARSDLAPDGHRLIGATVRAATEHHRLCQGGAPSALGGGADTGVGGESTLDMRTDAEALLAAGIELARANWTDFLDEVEWTSDTPARVITHQVGRAHDRALFAALGLPFEKGQVSYDRFGNVGSVSLPMTLALAAESGAVRSGDSVALLGIGSGLNSIMVGVKW